MVSWSDVGFDGRLGDNFVRVIAREVSETWVLSMVVGNDVDLHELLTILCVLAADFHGQAQFFRDYSNSGRQDITGASITVEDFGDLAGGPEECNFHQVNASLDCAGRESHAAIPVSLYINRKVNESVYSYLELMKQRVESLE